MRFNWKDILKWLKKHAWYIALLVASSIYVIHYRFEIHQLKEINAQNLIFILWLILLLFPLFSEMEFLGVKLKREIVKSNNEIKDAVHDLQLQIMQIANANNNNVRIENNMSLASQGELSDLLKGQQETQSSGGHSHNVNQHIEPSVSSETEFLFKVRYTLEVAMRRLCDKLGFVTEKSTLPMMTNFLRRVEIIQGSTYEIIKQIILITTRSAHGEIVSSEYISFVQKAYPNIMQELEDAQKNLKYTTCPRCKYSGYSKYENVCPQCNFTYDD